MLSYAKNTAPFGANRNQHIRAIIKTLSIQPATLKGSGFLDNSFINIASNMLTMAFNNSYDIAVLVSCDSDYATVLNTLRTMGKLSSLAIVDGQGSRLLNKADNCYTMREAFFNASLR